jgi:hypothetical protein
MDDVIKVVIGNRLASDQQNKGFTTVGIDIGGRVAKPVHIFIACVRHAIFPLAGLCSNA